MAEVRWHLWEGSTLVLEIDAYPAKTFTTVEYRAGGLPHLKTYRAFEYSPELGVVHAQLEREAEGFPYGHD